MASGLQCFGCGVQFGMFKREHSCKKCGHIFCSSCSSQSVVIPNQGTSKQRVCFTCYKEITSPTDVNKKLKNDLNRPPEPRIQTDDQASTTRLTMEPNIPVNGQSEASRSAKPPLDVDEMIRERLQKLKHDDTGTQNKVTDEDIGKRFENLSGRKPISQQPNNINAFVPKKTEQEEISDLLNQVTDECKLDDAVNSKGENSTKDGEISEAGNKNDDNSDEVQALINKTMEECKHEQNTEKDIEERLAGLKGIDPSLYRNTVPQDIDSDDEEAYNARYLQGVLHEAFLDDKTKAMGIDTSRKKEKDKDSQDKKSKGKTNDVDSSPYNKPSSIFSKEYEADSDDDELPWCCICNANAVLRCHGCDDDLYCKGCFREGHKDEGPEEHTVSSFRPKKKAS